MDEKPRVHPTDHISRVLFHPFIPHWVRPNHFTTLRFCLVPLVAWLFYTGDVKAGGVLFLIAALTDTIDGSLARVRNQITDWGKLYDPLADKLLVGSVLVILVSRYFGFDIAAIIICLEGFAIIGGYVFKKMGREVRANAWGKIKMVLQVTAILILVLAIVFNLPGLYTISIALLYISIFFSLLSLITFGI